ncbi:MAG TPA: carbohydrate ABC transporter permease [Firmicutes bacterium]|nr:carbohydrate ABC transporter permease [Bacillota bacterium]
MVLPLVYTVNLAFKPINELLKFPPTFFVRHPTTQNFKDLFAALGNSFIPLSRYLFNSIFISAVGTFGHVILASMAAYPLAKNKFPGKNFMFQTVVISLMFSGFVVNIPRFLLMDSLGWLDTYYAVIVPMMVSTLGLYLMKQFMEQINDAILEAARIDGASEFRIFWRIVMPNVKPAWLTLTLFAFQASWNDSGSVSLYIRQEAMKTFPLALSYVQAGGLARMGASAAVGFILMIPPITIFILTQSNVVETMKSSGMKD